MAEAFDFDFELLPADGPDTSADEALEVALRGLVEPDADERLPLGRSWAFDFLNGQFVRHGSAPATVSEVENLKMWIEKTLRTARFAHRIYSDQYGIDIVDLIGRPFDPVVIGRYQAAVRDALLVHDRISDVTGFRFARSAGDDAVFASFTVVLDEGEFRSDFIELGGL